MQRYLTLLLIVIFSIHQTSYLYADELFSTSAILAGENMPYDSLTSNLTTGSPLDDTNNSFFDSITGNTRRVVGGDVTGAINHILSDTPAYYKKVGSYITGELSYSAYLLKKTLSEEELEQGIEIFPELFDEGYSSAASERNCLTSLTGHKYCSDGTGMSDANMLAKVAADENEYLKQLKDDERRNTLNDINSDIYSLENEYSNYYDDYSTVYDNSANEYKTYADQYNTDEYREGIVSEVDTRYRANFNQLISATQSYNSLAQTAINSRTNIPPSYDYDYSTSDDSTHDMWRAISGAIISGASDYIGSSRGRSTGSTDIHVGGSHNIPKPENTYNKCFNKKFNYCKTFKNTVISECGEYLFHASEPGSGPRTSRPFHVRRNDSCCSEFAGGRCE